MSSTCDEVIERLLGSERVVHALARADEPTCARVLAEVLPRPVPGAAAALAAERRTDAQAQELRGFARAAADAPDAPGVQAADFAFFAGVVEAAGNIVFALVMNSIRPVYFEHAQLFAPMVAPEAGLLPLYEQAADAIARGDADAALAAVTELAERQQTALEAAL